MTLFDFENEIDPVILERGRKYYQNRNVRSLSEIKKNVWAAEVEGSYDNYEVEIKIGENAEIQYWECNCPYEHGEICKHSVATFFQMRELNTVEISENNPKKNSVKTKKLTLKKLLERISLDELQKFVLDYSSKNKAFIDDLQLYFAEKDENFDLGIQYEQIIKKIIKQHTKRGFIDYQDSKRLAKALLPIFKDAEAFHSRKNLRDAFLIAQKLLKNLIPVVEYTDDSGGLIGDLIYGSIHLTGEIAQDSPYSLQEKILDFIISELEKKVYFDYGDFGYDLTVIFEYLADQLGKTEIFMQFVEQKLNRSKQSSHDYDYIYFTELKVRKLSETGNEKEVEKIIEQNLEIPEIRKIEIEKYIEKQDFQKAKQLLNDGIQIAEKKNHRGTVHQWEKILLHIAHFENDRKLIRYYTKKFAFDSSFDSTYYNQWKNTFEKEEWETEIENTIKEITQRINKSLKTFSWGNNYSTFLHYLGPIYVQEAYWERLMELIRKQTDIDHVFPYQNYLKDEYKEELVDLYIRLLETFADYANSRPNYRELVRKMKKIIKDFPDAKERIQKLAQKLKAKYPHRPAMLDELNKFLG